MKRLLLLMTIWLVGLFPTQAQDGCDIDLFDEISQLTEAQRVANSGDAAAAARLIAEVQTQLATQLADCTQNSVPLSVTFESADGLFRFNHPDDWAQINPVNGVYAFSNNQTALNSVVETNFGEALPTGAYILVAAYGDLKTIFDADSFDDFLVQIQDSGLTSTARFVSPEKVVINDYQGSKLEVASDLFAGRAYLLDLHTNKAVFLAALTPKGEFEAFEPTFEALVASIQTGKKVTVNSEATPAVIVPNQGKPLSDITYAEAVKINDLIGENMLPAAALAPDGTRIAWFNGADTGNICLYTLADQTTQCQALPETFNSKPPVLLWSPDSHYLAFTQDGLRYFHEPDIWVFNTNGQTFVNRTDDNINRWRFSGEVGPEDSSGPLWFDHTFTWGPDGNIYFVRFVAPDATDFSVGRTGLYRIAPTEGDAELIRDLTDNFERFSIYQAQQYDLHGSLTVSPDASQIAFIVLAPKMDAPENGIWIMPLAGDQAPRQIVRAADLTAGTTADYRDSGSFMYPMALAWTPDQTGLYLFTSDPRYAGTVPAILYHIDITSGTLTPLTDFSQYSPSDLFKVDAATGHAPIYEVPRAVVMAPDGTTPLVFHFDPESRAAGLTALTLGDNGVERTTLFEFEFEVVPGQMTASTAADGKLLIFGTLFLPEE